MILKRKRVRGLSAYTKIIPAGSNVVVGTISPDPKKLQQIGFSSLMEDGESILPSPIGKVSMYNAEGKEVIHKNQPKETAYRTREWHWSQWHGRDRIERTELVDVPYKRYPRSIVPPPSIELTLATDTQGNRIVRSSLIGNWRGNEQAVVHAVNLLLEIFGEVTFFNESMEHIVPAPVKRLNWHVLPPGVRPFKKLKEELATVLSNVKKGNRVFTEHRLEVINGYNPDFAAVGTGGFTGYVILGFEKQNMYVLESILYGNATYVLGEQWEELSKKTKAEILDNSLHTARLVHHKKWENDVAALFRGKSK